MKILSIPLMQHDTSITIIEDGKISSYMMEERFSRKKHDHRCDKILDILLNANYNFDSIFFVFPCHKKSIDCKKIEIIEEKIKKIKNIRYNICEEQHHLYHAYSGFYNSNFEESLCFVFDGAGAVLNDNNLEIESIYYLNKKGKQKEIYKKFLKLKENDDVHNRLFENGGQSIGIQYDVFAIKNCGFSFHCAGKVMGLGQYKKHKEKLSYPYNTKEWKHRVDGAYNLQQKSQEYILNLIQKYTEETGIKNVVISGGYGLNCVANYHYLKNLKDINLYVDPITFDAGVSVGVAYYHYIQETGNNPPIQSLQNAYIGYQEESYNLSGLETQKVSYNHIVDLLLQKNIVALFQGKSESGQRALGNRSLLFDPRVSNGKDIVNQIKKRENFRPFAGTILQEEASKWFNMFSLKESPYMQYAMDAYENAIEQVPAIIHADNTCRIQTVTQEQNQHFYNLISCFFEKTGVPMLLNTSFNLGGEPLVETFEHAIHTLKNSMIEYLYLPEIETLITIKNKKLLYQ
jgi:carbamoyltransferase